MTGTRNSFSATKINTATKANFLSAQKQKPRSTVVTMIAEKKFSNGYNINATPEIRRLHSANISYASDWPVYSWFLQRREW